MRLFLLSFFCCGIYKDFDQLKQDIFPTKRIGCLFAQFFCTTGHFSWFQKFLPPGRNDSFWVMFSEYFPDYGSFPGTLPSTPDWPVLYGFLLPFCISLHKDIRYRIFWIKAIGLMKFFHERNKTVHIWTVPGFFSCFFPYPGILVCICFKFWSIYI